MSDKYTVEERGAISLEVVRICQLTWNELFKLEGLSNSDRGLLACRVVNTLFSRVYEKHLHIHNDFLNEDCLAKLGER